MRAPISMSFRAAVASCVALMVVGCGSRGVSTVLPSAGQHPGSAPAGVLRIVVDAQNTTTPSSTVRRPRWIDPASTQSIAFEVDAPTGVMVTNGSGWINLSATSTACTQAGALKALTCTFDLSQAVLPSKQTYTVHVVAYDKLQTGPCSTQGTPRCAGSVLSRATVAQVLTPNAQNTVSLVLGAFPFSITVTPLYRSLVEGSVSRLQLWGPTVHRLAIEALDYDGNAIVGSTADGAPTISVTSSDLSKLRVTAVDSNVFILTAVESGSPRVVTPSIVTLTISAVPAAGVSLAPVTRQVPVTISHSGIYAATGSSVSILYDRNTVPSVTITKGFKSANGVALDAAGTMYVCDTTANAIHVYPPGGTIAVRDILPAGVVSFPCTGSMTVDAAGTLYALDTNPADDPCGGGGGCGYGGVVNEYPSGSSVLSGQYLPSPGTPILEGGPDIVGPFINVDLYGHVLVPVSVPPDPDICGDGGPCAEYTYVSPNYFSGGGGLALVPDSAGIDSQGNIFLALGDSPYSTAPGPLGVYNPQQVFQFSLPGSYSDLKIDAGDYVYAVRSAGVDVYAPGFKAGAAAYQSIPVPAVQDIFVVPPETQ